MNAVKAWLSTELARQVENEKEITAKLGQGVIAVGVLTNGIEEWEVNKVPDGHWWLDIGSIDHSFIPHDLRDGIARLEYTWNVEAKLPKGKHEIEGYEGATVEVNPKASSSSNEVTVTVEGNEVAKLQEVLFAFCASCA